MEFEGLGKHCSAPLCKQKDFLPFTCDACSLVYCLEHRSYATHDCSKAGNRDHRAIVCPLCAQTIHFSGSANENVYAVFEEHQRSTCSPEKRAERKAVNRCAAAGCKEKLLLSNKTTCPKCHQDVCLRHRHEDDHACPRVPPGRESFLSSLGRAWQGAGAGAGASAGPARNAGPVRRQPLPKKQPPKPQDLLRETAHRRQQQQQQQQQQGGQGQGGATPSSTGSSVATAGSGPQARPQGSEACPHCSRTFHDAVALVAHVEQSHSEGEAPTPCPRCGAVFTSLPALVEHVETRHGQGQGRQAEESSTCVLL